MSKRNVLPLISDESGVNDNNKWSLLVNKIPYDDDILRILSPIKTNMKSLITHECLPSKLRFPHKIEKKASSNQDLNLNKKLVVEGSNINLNKYLILKTVAPDEDILIKQVEPSLISCGIKLLNSYSISFKSKAESRFSPVNYALKIHQYTRKATIIMNSKQFLISDIDYLIKEAESIGLEVENIEQMVYDFIGIDMAFCEESDLDTKSSIDKLKTDFVELFMEATILVRDKDSWDRNLEILMRDARSRGLPVSKMRKVLNDEMENENTFNKNSRTESPIFKIDDNKITCRTDDKINLKDNFLNLFQNFKDHGHTLNTTTNTGNRHSSDLDHQNEVNAIEVDLVDGFLKKEYSNNTLHLIENKKNCRDRLNKKDSFVKYSDFHDKIALKDKKNSTISSNDENYSDYVCLKAKHLVAEYRNTNNGDAEIYLMDESNVEVAFLDDEKEKKVTEKSRNICKKEFDKGFKKESDHHFNASHGRKNSKKALRMAKLSRFFGHKNNRFAAIDRYYRQQQEKVIRNQIYEHLYMVRKLKRKVLNNNSHPDLQSTSNTNTSSAHTFISVNGNSINGVAAASTLMKRPSCRMREYNGQLFKPHWLTPYHERTSGHCGYFDVDYHSLIDASVVTSSSHPLDNVPWEFREVKQRFLFEKGIADVRNWFGILKKIKGNEKYYEPISHPKSVEFQIDHPPEQGEWDEDWFTTWQSRRENPNNLILHERDEYSKHDIESYNTLRDHNSSKYNSNCNKNIIGDVPEIGVLSTVRLKVGEPISRLHYDFTSSLRRSRWRKKYISENSLF